MLNVIVRFLEILTLVTLSQGIYFLVEVAAAIMVTWVRAVFGQVQPMSREVAHVRGGKGRPLFRQLKGAGFEHTQLS